MITSPMFSVSEDSSEDPSTAAAGFEFHDLFTNETRLIFQWVCCTVLGQVIAFFGSVTNVINIVCFVKQGFKESVNISLLGLSISDLCALMTVAWTNTCYIPPLLYLDLLFDPLELQLLIGTWPHLTFNHVTSCITAFITLERCLCVTMPTRVKAMITSRKVTVIIISIFATNIAAVSPIYFVFGHGMKFSPLRNKTILGVIYTSDRMNTETVSYAINNIFIPFSAFIMVIICTVLLVFNLRMKTKWRQQSTTSGQFENLSNRDQKIARMMLTVSILFIATFFPVCVLNMVMIGVPELSMDGKLQNGLFVLGSVIFVLQSTNSASNIFIYYQMSSKYRSVFHEFIFCDRMKLIH